VMQPFRGGVGLPAIAAAAQRRLQVVSALHYRTLTA
jgi:hypothetical protein